MLRRRSFLRINNVLNILSKSSSTTSSPPIIIKPNDAHAVKQSEVTLQQAPNFPTTWSTSQRPRPGPYSGPRFEQTDMSLQPNPLSAMELVAQEPIRLVKGRKAVCDGGSSLLGIFSYISESNFSILGIGPLGHPKIYINLVSRFFHPSIPVSEGSPVLFGREDIIITTSCLFSVYFILLLTLYFNPIGPTWSSCMRVSIDSLVT